MRVLSSLPLGLALAVFVASPAPAYEPTWFFINELHYDNTGTDTGEFVEIAGPGGFDLTGWSLVLYNGATGGVYSTINLSGTIPAPNPLSVSTPSIQNGPDAIALVDSSSNVVQFLSYEGSFTATDGVAAGLTAVDIGVEEPSTTPVGHSLQLTGTGTKYEDFTWAGPMANTSGLINTGQVLDLWIITPVPSISFGGLAFLAGLVVGIVAWQRRLRVSRAFYSFTSPDRNLPTPSS